LYEILFSMNGLMPGFQEEAASRKSRELVESLGRPQKVCKALSSSMSPAVPSDSVPAMVLSTLTILDPSALTFSAHSP
jgi:hypothetical protein